MTLPYPLTFNFDGREWTEHFDSPNPLTPGFAELVFRRLLDKEKPKPKTAYCAVWADQEGEDAIGCWSYDGEEGTVEWEEDS